MNAIPLQPLDLILAAITVAAVAGCSWLLRLGIGRSLLIAAARMALQLLLVGFILKALFESGRFLWVLLASVVMLTAAAREVSARQKRRLAGARAFGIGMLSMFLSSMTLAVYALVVVLSPEPWYAPQYAIPLFGMLLGNTMNGIAVAMDRLTQTVWEQRVVIEQRLMLGETAKETVVQIRNDCIRGGLIPVINAMAAAGLVSLPGMMTGQILAGSPPTLAVLYQIMIWLLIAAGSGAGTIAAVYLTVRQLFDDRDRLRVDRLRVN